MGGVPFDPEVLLSTLPALANVAAGYFARDSFLSHRNRKTEMGLKFFEVFGRNPLVLYILSYLIIKLLFYVQVDGERARLDI
ncbi:hypothetical protein [Pollutibacter soli]|uniref:hypothetical protein n=1 Tax=Pollutibacter soli TaxID=3034157 RepID=UPI0030140BF9